MVALVHLFLPELTGMLSLKVFAFEDSDDETLKATQIGSDSEISWLVSEGSFLLFAFFVCLRACCWSVLIFS